MSSKPLIGFHAPHEQYAPSELLRYVALAERAGFGGAMCSDHFAPWSDRQGQSGYTWSWLGAAMQATRLSFGTVSAPGDRYHPAVLAQAAATLAEMYPERLWLALGSGEALNEHITGARWPPKSERNERLRESAEVMRRLFRGESVTHDGHVRVVEAKLYTRPRRAPALFAAALSSETAEWAGAWADGLITTAGPLDAMKEIVAAFRRGGGEGKPLYLQFAMSWAEREEDALEGAWDQWRTVVLGSAVQATLRTPADFDAVGEFVTREQMREKLKISADPRDFSRWVREYADVGFERIYLHNVNRNQERFIERFGELVREF